MKIAFIFQLIVAVFSLSFFCIGFLKFFKREKSQTVFKFIANSFIWLSIAGFAIFPNAAHNASKNLGFGESLNTFIFIGFIIVFIILFKIINIIERTERNISEIVRKEALSKIVKEK